MSSEIAWVAKLSCGHNIGSVPPPEPDVDPPMDSVAAAQRGWMGGAAGAVRKPIPPAFVEPPDVEQLVYCGECNEGRWVVGIIHNVEEPLPRLDERRAGRRW